MANQKENIQDSKNAAETAPKINYTRTQLLVFGQCRASKEQPKSLFDLSGADEKRKEKLRNILKYTNFSQTFYRSKSPQSNFQAICSFLSAISIHYGIILYNNFRIIFFSLLRIIGIPSIR